MAYRARESPGEEKSTYKEEETRACSGTLTRSLTRSFARSLARSSASKRASERANEHTVHTGRERTERASERARSL